MSGRPVVAALCGVVCAAALGGDDSTRLYLGAADASAAVRIDDATILVGDDEDNVLRLYDARGGAPRATLDVSRFLGLDEHQEADLEAAARIGDRVYWITSHAPSRTGRVREARRRFFAIEVRNPGGTLELRPVGRPCSTLLEPLAAALGDAVRPADRAELNIEALAVGADGRTLWIGLRAPLARTPAEECAIVPLRNPDRVIERGDAPELGPVVLWSLGGRAPRDMVWSTSRRQMFILAAGESARDDWQLLRWSGDASVVPQPVALANPRPRGVQPEALVELAPGGPLLVLSDDGHRAAPKSFRGFEVYPRRS